MSKEKWKERFFLVFIFIILLLWMFIVPYNQGPDELARIKVPLYLAKHLQLPFGGDPEVRIDKWGFSYAFQPILGYFLPAFFMKIGMIFKVAKENLYLWGRMATVIYSVITVYLTMKIGDRLFSKRGKWFFVILVSFLPMFQFISCYINLDAFAVMCVTWVIYQLLVGKENNWNTKSCIILGISLGVTALSYSNSYGIIICAIIYCVWDVITCKEIENKPQFLLKKATIVAGVSFLVAGWWFIRNGIIYNGDFLGFKTSNIYAKKYAIPMYLPDNRGIINSENPTLSYMLFDRRWIHTTLYSFVGTFGNMNVFMEHAVSWLFFMIPILSLILYLVKDKNKKFDMFYFIMFIMCIITTCLNMYYSFFNDFQPQGRYCMPMLIPLMLLITKGFEAHTKKDNGALVKHLSYLVILISLYSFYYLIYGHYINPEFVYGF